MRYPVKMHMLHRVSSRYTRWASAFVQCNSCGSQTNSRLLVKRFPLYAKQPIFFTFSIKVLIGLANLEFLKSF